MQSLNRCCRPCCSQWRWSTCPWEPWRPCNMYAPPSCLLRGTAPHPPRAAMVQFIAAGSGTTTTTTPNTTCHDTQRCATCRNNPQRAPARFRSSTSTATSARCVATRFLRHSPPPRSPLSSVGRVPRRAEDTVAVPPVPVRAPPSRRRPAPSHPSTGLWLWLRLSSSSCGSGRPAPRLASPAGAPPVTGLSGFYTTSYD